MTLFITLLCLYESYSYVLIGRNGPFDVSCYITVYRIFQGFDRHTTVPSRGEVVSGLPGAAYNRLFLLAIVPLIPWNGFLRRCLTNLITSVVMLGGLRFVPFLHVSSRSRPRLAGRWAPGFRLAMMHMHVRYCVMRHMIIPLFTRAKGRCDG